MNAHNEQQARKLLALGLDEFGHHTEAANVRKGVDLDDYKVDLWAIRAALDAHPAAAQEAVGVDAYDDALDQLWKLAGGNDHPVYKRFLDFRDSFAAPVTTVPAGVTRAVADEAPFGLNATERAAWARGFNDALEAASTHAAPGIDLHPIRYALKYAAAAARENTHSELAEDFDELIRKLDASPKGDEAQQAGAQAIAIVHMDGYRWNGGHWQKNSPKGGSEAQDVENVAEDTYHAIAEVLRTEDGWSVLEHVEYCRELIWEARVALGMDGANADTNHRHRGLWVKLGRCLEGFAPGSDEALSELSKCDCENPCPETGAALVSMACPIHNDLPAAQASDAEGRP